MRMNRRGWSPVAVVFFSLFLLMTFSNAQADETAANPTEGQGNTLSASATGVSELPEVTVKAKGIDQAAAFDQMHDSLNKVNILSQDQINQTPAKTVAQAAEQLPGVGTQHDTSEPRYISIRGTDTDLDIITFDGTIIPSYDEAARSVDLDAIPAGLFGEMQLYKTILPDMDAQGVGGQLNLVSKKAQDYAGEYFNLKAEGEFFPERNQPGARGEFTWANTWGMGGDSKLGILVTGGYQFSKFGIDDIENDYSDPADSPLVRNSVNDYAFDYYDMERERAGIGTNLNLDLDKTDKLYANFLYSGYDEYRNPKLSTTYNNLDATADSGAIVNADGSITIPDVTVPGVNVQKKVTDELTEFRTLATGLGGQNDLGGFSLDYKASFAYTDQNVPYDHGYTFKSGPVTGSLSYNNSTNNGNSPSFDFSGLGGTDTDPSQYKLSKFSNSTNDYNVASYGLKADGKLDVPLGGTDASTFKFGGAARLEYSTFTNASFSSAKLSTFTLDQVLDPNSITFYPGDIYSMGPEPSYAQLTSLFNSPNAYQGPFVQDDPVGDKGGDYDNWEDVYAGYGMYTVKAGPMEVMTGARFEATHIQYTWYQAYKKLANGDPDTDNELAAARRETGTINYTNILPSLGFKYAFNSSLITRANYSQTIARPTQNQYIPSFSLGQALDTQSNNSFVQFTFGNPKLKPMISNNIDFSCEFYPQKGAILGVDFFIKDIQNYFEQNYSRVDGSGGVGSGGVTDSINYVNIPTSDIYGAELQYQQQYTMLPDPFDGIGFRGSISFIGSQGELAQGIYGELPSQSDLIWETGVFYKKGGLTLDVAGNFTGKNLNVVGDPTADNSPNIFADDYFQINAKAQYAFTKDFKIYADGNNLNNASLRYYWGSPNLPIQNEYYGPSFDAGLDVSF